MRSAEECALLAETPSYRMLIGGRAVSSERQVIVINPATEKVIGHVPDCDPEQLELAIAEASQAFLSWRREPLSHRAEVLIRIASTLEENVDELSVLLTREQGKPLAEARGELFAATEYLRRISERNLPTRTFQDVGGREVHVQRVPYGVVAAIAPFNYPIVLALWKVAPALLTGNTVIVKPSPFTPITTLRIGELCRNIIPPGVLNVISGGDSLGPALSAHAGISKIAFTGSTATGRAVLRSASHTLKRVTLELGGNDPAIVFPDVDVGEVAERLFWGAFGNAGQVCVAAKRIYVHETIYDEFFAAMRHLVETNVPANGELDGTRIGPVQTKAQFDRLHALVAEASDAGIGMYRSQSPLPDAGYFVRPTIVDNPPDESKIVTDEAFGPIVPILRFNNIDEVVYRANQSQYGLAASVWSHNDETICHVSEHLECGTVWINSVRGLTADTPFAGHKQSGIGIENGEEGLVEYTNVKVVIR